MRDQNVSCSVYVKPLQCAQQTIAIFDTFYIVDYNFVILWYKHKEKHVKTYRNKIVAFKAIVNYVIFDTK